MRARASILEDLTPSQREAVTILEGPVLVLAGAGSGKTRVITYRTAYLMDNGVEGHRILCLTFTNKAAGEMRDRVISLLGLGASRGVGVPFMSTFHSFCLWALRRFADRLGYSLDFAVIDETDQIGVVKEVLKELDLDPKRFSPKALLSVISSVKMSGNPDVLKQSPMADVLMQIYKRYIEYTRKYNLMDFDDLLLNTLRLLEEDKVARSFLQNRFSHVMVDEYQDTNRVQYMLIKRLVEPHENIFVVGDDDQSIYSWRGADIRNILDFEQDFPSAKVIKLEENFRSTSVILDAAWHVVKNNTLRKEKRLRAVRKGGEKVRLYMAKDERDEARFVVSEIKRLGRPYNHYAVFYRTNAQSRPFEEELVAAGIPYVVVGGLRFYERKEIKDILAYLRLIRNPDDAVSFKRIVNVPSRGIGARTVEKIFNLIDELKVPLWQGLKLIVGKGLLPSGPRLRLSKFISLVEELRGMMDLMPLSEFVSAVIERTGYMAMLEAEGTHEAQGRMENLQELINVASEYDDEEDALSLFLDRSTLTTDIDETKEEDAVTLMTLHSAKGLEFPVVFMVGMEDGLLPHYRNTESPFYLEEERRLCYVGMTRAKELLYLTRAEERKYYGVTKKFRPSPFLDEIPRDLIEDLSKRETLETPDGPSSEDAPFSKGDLVIHPRFGKGLVIGVSKGASFLKVKVRFYKYGVKVMAHTSLKKVG